MQACATLGGGGGDGGGGEYEGGGGAGAQQWEDALRALPLTPQVCTVYLIIGTVPVPSSFYFK